MSTDADKFGPIHEVDERQLTLLMRDWRRGRATRTLRQAISDAYVAIFTVVLIGAMVISAIVQAQRLVAGCETDACMTGRSLLPWAALAAAFAFTLAISLMFGPVVASAAEGFWLMEAPLNRRALLTKRLWMALGAAWAAGTLFGALVAALTGSPPLAVAAWAAATGIGSAGLAAFAAAEQGAERRWLVRTVQTIVSLGGIAAMVLVIGTAAGWFTVRPAPIVGLELALVVAAAGLLLGIGAVLVGRRRLNNIRRQRLMSGGSLLSGMQGAMFALDFGLFHDILVERKAAERGHVRPTRGSGLGLRALVLRDVQRVVRYPRPLLFWLATMIVPYAVYALGIGVVGSTLSALFLVAALVPFMNSLRVLSRTKGLARCFPVADGKLRSAAMVVPAVLAGIWALAVTPAFAGIGTEMRADPVQATIYAFITAAAGLIGAIRWVSAKPADYQAPMVATQMGALPPGLAFNVFRGFDMVALITFPLVLGWSPWISAIIGLIAFGVLRSGMDREALMEEQAEQKRQLEEAKAERNKPKQKIKVERRR